MFKNNEHTEKQRFSIKKYSFGVTSALVGVFLAAGANAAQAEEVKPAATPAPTATTQAAKPAPVKASTNVNTIDAEGKKIEVNGQVLHVEHDSGNKTYRIEKAETPQNVTKLEIPNTVNNEPVTRVGGLQYNEFKEYSELKEVKLNNNLKEIAQSSFENTSIKTVTIPASVTSVGDRAFSTPTLEEVRLEKPVGDVNYGGTQYGLVTTGSFADTPNLKKVVFKDADNWKVLPDRIFQDSGLEKVELPKNLETIASEAFLDSQLKEITLPSTLKVIGNRAFANTPLAGKVEIPEGVIKFNVDIFANTPNLKEIYLPLNIEVNTDSVDNNAYKKEGLVYWVYKDSVADRILKVKQTNLIADIPVFQIKYRGEVELQTKPTPEQSTPVKTEPVKTEPVKVEPVKSTPAPVAETVTVKWVDENGKVEKELQTTKDKVPTPEKGYLAGVGIDEATGKSVYYFQKQKETTTSPKPSTTSEVDRTSTTAPVTIRRYDVDGHLEFETKTTRDKISDYLHPDYLAGETVDESGNSIVVFQKQKDQDIPVTIKWVDENGKIEKELQTTKDKVPTPEKGYLAGVGIDEATGKSVYYFQKQKETTTSPKPSTTSEVDRTSTTAPVTIRKYDVDGYLEFETKTTRDKISDYLHPDYLAGETVDEAGNSIVVFQKQKDQDIPVTIKWVDENGKVEKELQTTKDKVPTPEKGYLAGVGIDEATGKSVYYFQKQKESSLETSKGESLTETKSELHLIPTKDGSVQAKTEALVQEEKPVLSLDEIKTSVKSTKQAASKSKNRKATAKSKANVLPKTSATETNSALPAGLAAALTAAGLMAIKRRKN